MNGVIASNDRINARDDTARERDLTAGRRVLSQEAEAVAALAETLDTRFCDALDILEAPSAESPRGRVIVTGMGKSGHVGRKIAATLASTGTPAQYVHPAEASHGDLGMITERDAILALSNSGETKELSDILEFSERFRIPLIAITAQSESTLARIADVALILPPHREAATMGLAPTTSTTLSIALGDALAVALLERKGFTASDFRLFHPGGKLGRQLQRVGDLMHVGDEIPLITVDQNMAGAMITMTSKHFGVVGVTDPSSGALVGIITDGDLRRHMAPDLTEKPVVDVMTRDPVTAGPEDMASQILAVLNERRITAIFIVDSDNRPRGIVHIHDFLRQGVA